VGSERGEKSVPCGVEGIGVGGWVAYACEEDARGGHRGCREVKGRV
jgi:hypothetical protein